MDRVVSNLVLFSPLPSQVEDAVSSILPALAKQCWASFP